MSDSKWQRILYMPGTPLHGRLMRVTGCAEHRALSRKAATEGMVLLKNENALFPLKKGEKIAVFGKAQADYVKGGGGSGDVTVAYIRSLYDGLSEKESEGKIALFDALSAYYHDYVAERYALGEQPGCIKEPPISEELLQGARAFTDTALITISRFSGEGYDRTGTAFDGDFFLSREEWDMVETVKQVFPRIGVVLNTGGMMDTIWFKEDARISAALLAWQGGMEGGMAIADVLCGDVCPSGHLTDTFATDFAAYPSSASFNASPDYVEYEDDIYVGYRYFETIPGAQKKVCYPFGYGLSYTTFKISAVQMTEQNGQMTVTAEVENTGNVAGRHVVEVYCSAPQGKLGKPKYVLVGFKKTPLLTPSEKCSVTIQFNRERFASYDDVGKVQKSAYLLEAGEYAFYIGSNVEDTEKIPFTYTLHETVILSQLSEKCIQHNLKQRLCADGTYESMPNNGSAKPIEDKEYPFDGQQPKEHSSDASVQNPTLMDVYNGKCSVDALIEKMSNEQLVRLLCGQPNRGCANTFGFGNQSTFGIPNVMTADGPAGLRIHRECGVNTTAFPCATMLACTWDEELIEQVGHAAAEEVAENGIGVWLTPAINIHRSPLCGRNFEYYSEDPLVAGKLASAMIRGIQSVGVGASLKHFACNNKETNRRDSDSRLSERALREIYIKAFEICVKEAKPLTIMSSYNIINGTRASENHDLLTDILRGEWGFDGAVTTDWWTHGEQWREIAAGNDIKMGCGMPEHTLRMIDEGKLDIEDVKTNVRRVLKMILKLA